MGLKSYAENLALKGLLEILIIYDHTTCDAAYEAADFAYRKRMSVTHDRATRCRSTHDVASITT